MSYRTYILGTAGHIDHGKTSLVRALTGVDTDRLPQEKERGITIDIGFARLDLGKHVLGIIDVPGHERFIRNMLAGASGIDLAMLVVAADDSVMPQTREHLAILELLRIPRGLIALTKSDLAEPAWLDLVEADIRELVQDTFLEGAPIVRTSAATGAGVEELKEQLGSICDAIVDARRDLPFRLSVDRAFVGQGVGTIITGTVASGALASGGQIDWLPAQKVTKVRSLQSHGTDADRVSAGQRAAINLINVHHTEIHRGHVLAEPGYLKPSRLVTAQVRVLPGSPWPLRHRARVRLHLGTQEIMASVRLLEGDAIDPGGKMLAQLILAEPAVAVARQPFVIRAESPLVTIGGGMILQPVVARLLRRRDTAASGQDGSALDRIRQLASADPCERAEAAIWLARGTQFDEHRLMREADLDRAQVDDVLEALRSRGAVLTLARRIIHVDAIEFIELRLLAIIERAHANSPLDPAVPRSALKRELAWMVDESLLDAVIDRLVDAGRLTASGTTVSHTTFKPRLTERQRDLVERIRARFLDAAFAPPDSDELGKELDIKANELRSLLELCAESGDLVHIGGGNYLHADHEREARRRVSEALNTTSGLAMSEIRDLLGTSRKFAVPICEHLDRIGLTRRVGDVRVLNAAK